MKEVQDIDDLRRLYGSGSWAWSAFQAGKYLGIARPDASRLLQRCRRRGWVDHSGSWSLTEAGRSAIAHPTTQGGREP